MFASKGTEKCALQTAIAFDSKGCGRFSVCCHTYMEPKITQLSCCGYFMPHCASCQCGDPCLVSLGVFFSSCFYLFFPFFSLHLPQPLTHFSLLWGVGERDDQAFRLCCCFVLGAVCSGSQGAEPGRPQSSCTLHTPGSQPKSPPQFLFTDKFLMLIYCLVFFLLKMYPYFWTHDEIYEILHYEDFFITLHLNRWWDSPCEKQTDVMLCALQVVALLICCFPNNSRFFYFASVFVASCYLLAKTKQASLVSKAFHQLSHQHFASLVSFAFVLCLLHSH